MSLDSNNSFIMPEQGPMNVELAAYLGSELDTYEEHMLRAGTTDTTVSSNAPSLTNDVLPMFNNRWLRGPGQFSALHQGKLYPAFRLASRWLSDEHCLEWFANLTYGTRKKHPDGGDTYLEPNALSSSKYTIPTIRDNIAQLGRRISFMWIPRAHSRGTWAVTFLSRSEALQPYPDNQTQLLSWPQTPKDYPDPPVVCMSMEFRDYLENGFDTAPADEQYRALFIFAVTIVHEVAHAYHAWRDWLEDEPLGHEPLCSLTEQRAEVGWSWENHILGFAVHSDATAGGKFGMLIGTNAAEFTTLAEREALYAQIKGPAYADQEFTDVDVNGKKVEAIPKLPNDDPDCCLFLRNGRDKELGYSVGMYAIPMEWVVKWFNEQQWQHNMSVWRQQGSDLARITRPLVPGIQVDDEILRDRENGDMDR